jgi:hypothetical protein
LFLKVRWIPQSSKTKTGFWAKHVLLPSENMDNWVVHSLSLRIFNQTILFGSLGTWMGHSTCWTIIQLHGSCRAVNVGWVVPKLVFAVQLLFGFHAIFSICEELMNS